MSTPAKILVVDDEPDLAALVRQIFRRKIRAGEYEFLFAGDGLQALEHIERDEGIDVVLTDLNMPRMDGLTLLNRLHTTERVLKPIVVTAYGDIDNIRAAMNRGAFDFLTKPLDLEDLQITIDKALVTVEQLRRALLVHETFGRYLSAEVVASLLSGADSLKLGGEKRKVTVLMSDLRGFSTISERHAPEEVVDMLNIYLGEMADVITAFGGTIDEFIGDGILVIFGAPIQYDDDAFRAVSCALGMQLAMEKVNARLNAMGMPTLHMGIGINTGEVVVGNIGSIKRMKYGVVGSHVNLTSRIESFTVGGQILISERTLKDAGSEVRIGKKLHVSVKGFAEPVNLYEVEGVGWPYNLWLPARADRMVVLKTPLNIRLMMLDGTHLTGRPFSGRMLQLSESSALLQTEEQVEPLSNLKLLFSGTGESKIQGELYAKVVDLEDGTIRVRFTAVPQDLAAGLYEFYTAQTI